MRYLEYRRYVDAAMAELIEGGMPEEAERRVTLGLHHEQQHQELLAYDIKNAFWSNPLHPAYREGELPAARMVEPVSWIGIRGRPVEIGYQRQRLLFRQRAAPAQGLSEAV